jgi:hypothetical protein
MHGTVNIGGERQRGFDAPSRKAPAQTCYCNLCAPPARELRSVEFNRELAGRVAALNISGDATIDLVLSELLDHRAGVLTGPDGIELPLDSTDADDVAWFDELFSGDPRRFINRYKSRANGAGAKNRLQAHLALTVALIFLALEVRDCRMSGRCAHIREGT